MHTFDDIYVLDLHGNAKKKEIAPDGGKDENVFDIQQGVAIGIFVKEPGKTGPAQVHHAELWGKRQDKYDWLPDNGLETTPWQELAPQAPFYLFVPQNVDFLAEYQQGWKVTDIFPVNSVGIVTSRDSFVLDYTETALVDRVQAFLEPSLTDDQAGERFLAPNDKLPVGVVRKKLSARDWRRALTPCADRPFDLRMLLYVPESH